MLTDQKDPVTTIAKYVRASSFGEHHAAALEELERRAAVERRLEAWLSANHCRFVYVGKTAGKLVVSLYRNGRAFEDGNETGQGYESDYWTALDAALTAAGAPK